jgi:high-affinity Fe2+/Pb2+ permease
MNEQALAFLIGVAFGAALAFFSGFAYLSTFKEFARRESVKAKEEYEAELKRLRIFMADHVG